MGYENHNALTNLNTIGVLIMIWHIKIMLTMCLCKPLSKNHSRCASCYESYINSLVFAEIIFLCIEGYFEMLIAGYLNIKLPLLTTSGEIWGTVLGTYCLFIALAVIPSLLLWMMFQNIYYINTEVFKSKFKMLHYGIKPFRKWTLLYTTIFIVRRNIFVSVAFNMINLPCQQIQMIMFMNIAVYIYDGDAMPMNSKLKNYIELFNEFTITIVTMHLLCYTDWVVSK